MKGFTLIETLVYLALFALIVGGVVASAYALFETSGYNQTASMVLEEQGFVLARFARVVEAAQSIDSPAAGASGPAMTVTTYDGTMVTMAGSGGTLAFAGQSLSNTNVLVSDVIFTHTSALGAESVTFSFTMSAQTPEGRSVRRGASLTEYLHK